MLLGQKLAIAVKKFDQSNYNNTLTKRTWEIQQKVCTTLRLYDQFKWYNCERIQWRLSIGISVSCLFQTLDEKKNKKRNDAKPILI